MTLQELLAKVGDETQLIALLVDSEWCCVFPAMYCPCQYDDYGVIAFLPDEFKGDSPFDGKVLKVWVEEPGSERTE